MPFARAAFVLLAFLAAGCGKKASTREPVEACPSGTVSCNGACTTLATDVRSCGACGTVCAPTEECQGGTCVAPCSVAGLARCGDACVDLASSSPHCGACGIACGAAQVCQAGACVDACTLAGATRCEASCVDLASSSAHCGACGTACGDAAVCRSGACVDTCALAGTTRCGVACVDLGSSSAHCGACGKACPAGAICQAGTCVDGCALAGTTRCGELCASLATDPANCGACGRSCGATAICRGGACVDTCTLAGATRCGEACVDVRADAANCGVCGHACPSWGTCVNGGCAAPACRSGFTLPDAAPVIPGAPLPNSLLVVDLNGDGLEDLVTFSRWQSNPKEVAVALGLPGGGFGPADIYVVPEAGLLVATDLDGDGDLDLNIAGMSTRTRLLNDGTGHFELSSGGAPLRVRADLDGDGRLDDVLDWQGYPGIEIHLARTSTVQRFPSDPNQTRIRAVDLTGDGRPELLVARYGSESLDVLMNAGDGTFTLVSYADRARVLAPAAAEVIDVDGDGDLDVVFLELWGTVVVARNDGRGNLGPFDAYPLPALFGPYWDLVAADVDHDGHPDLLVGTEVGVVLLHGAAEGVFGAPHLIPTTTTRQLAVLDVDHDGRLDLLAAVRGGVEVLRGRGGGLAEPPSLHFPGIEVDAVADLDGDGRDDLVAAVTSTDGTTSLVVRRSGSADVVSQPVPGASSLAVADVDGDRILDVIADSYPAPLFLRGRGDGTFEPGVAVTAIQGTPVLAADLTGDGVTDLVATHDIGSSTRLLRVAIGRGAGRFDPALAPTTLPHSYLSRLALGDVDGDGRAEVIFARTPQAYSGKVIVSVFRAHEDGSFGAPVEVTLEVPLDGVLDDLLVSDLDGDGAADIAVAVGVTSFTDSSGRLAVLWSSPGGLQAPAWYPLPLPVWSLASVRATGGRLRDLVALDGWDVVVLSARGARRFDPPARFALPRGAHRILGADLDGDLRDELLVTVGTTAVTVLRTACAP